MFCHLFYFVLALSYIECSSIIGEYQIVQQNQKIDKPFSFASYYQDHMVLQAAPWEAVIWGYSQHGSVGQVVKVTVVELKVTYTTVVGSDYKWAVKLKPIQSGGPYTVLAVLGGLKITLNDVLFGDMWLCSGQSNMQFTMSQVFNSTEEIKDALNYPDVRVFTVNDITSSVPLDDLATGGISQPWSLPGLGNFTSFSAVCWLYGKYLYQNIKKPIGLIDTSWGGTPVEAWSSPDALKKCGLAKSKVWDSSPKGIDSIYSSLRFDPNVAPISKDIHTPPGPMENSVLWNAMIHPFLNMTIYGAIWYQGEANANKNMDLYNCTFPAMIDDWRKKFRQSSGTSSLFPFGFVQLSGNRPDRSIKKGFPDIRWHQTADYGYVPNHRIRKVFMAVAMDLPDFLSPYDSIHPRDKQDVAYRLVLSSLAVAYNQSVQYQGPFPVHLTSEDWEEGAIVNLTFTAHVEQRAFDGFEICCSFVSPPVCQDGKSWWIPAAVTPDIYDRSSSNLLTTECTSSQITGVRYAWLESPCTFKKCAIYDIITDLPMPPYTFSDEGFLRLVKKRG